VKIKIQVFKERILNMVQTWLYCVFAFMAIKLKLNKVISIQKLTLVRF